MKTHKQLIEAVTRGQANAIGVMIYDMLLTGSLSNSEALEDRQRAAYQLAHNAWNRGYLSDDEAANYNDIIYGFGVTFNGG